MAASVGRRRAGRFTDAGVLALAVAVAPGAQAAASPSVTVIASGLDNPRGLAFGPDGTLYVAEAGRGGSGACLPAPEDPEGGEVCFGLTGAVTQIQGGRKSRVVRGLPSLAASDGSAATGPSDVSLLRRLGFVTVGLGANPAARAQLADSNPQAVQVGPRRADVSDARGNSLVQAVLRGNPAARAHLLPSGRTLGRLWTFTPGVRRAVPLAEVAGHEASANPDGGQVDSNPQAVHAAALRSPTPGVTRWSGSGSTAG